MNEEFAVLLFFFGISLTVNVALAVGVFRAARRARRFEARVLATGPADDPRMERVEQAVDTLEARVEQLARGQEFLSKLVAERRRVPAPREREITPHS